MLIAKTRHHFDRLGTYYNSCCEWLILKGAEDHVGREGTLKSTRQSIEGTSIRPPIKLPKNDELTSILLSAGAVVPNLGVITSQGIKTRLLYFYHLVCTQNNF